MMAFVRWRVARDSVLEVCLPCVVACQVDRQQVSNILEVAKIEFFYDQAPEGMKSLGTSYAMTSLGVGNFLSSFLLSTVSRVTRRRGGGHGGWIQNNLNASRLDLYYAFAVLNCANLLVFFAVCRMYVYNADIADGGKEKQGRPGMVKEPTVPATE